jgi:hypothetical protein
MKPPYVLINKSLFFPSSGTLAISDLHLGYEHMLKTSGFEFPINQLEETQKELEIILSEIKRNGFAIKKIVILGDLKHHFNFEIEEKYRVREFLNFLEKKLNMSEKNIILLKGNHEKIELDKKRYRDFYIDKKEKIAFAHGDKSFPEIIEKEINTLVLGHLHPAVYVSDTKNHKKEKFKCFLIGKWKNKNCIILPSFLQIIEGTDIRNSSNKKDDKFLIIPKKQLLKFRAFVVGENKVYDFGKLEKI